MPRKRMIDPTIWEDENFGKLSKDARLLFIGLFSNADDEGRIRANPSYIRSTIFMYDDLSIKKIEDLTKEVCSIMNSVSFYEVNENKFIQLVKWNDYQKQQKDRVQASILPSLASAKQVLSSSIADAKQMLTQVKLSKDKISQVKLSKDKASLTYLTDDILQEIVNDYQVPLSFVQSKLDDMKNWSAANGKTYKDYNAALRNWVKKDAINIRKEEYAKSKVAIILD